MDMSQFNPNDPRVQQLLMALRAQQGGGMPGTMPGGQQQPAMGPQGVQMPQGGPVNAAPLQNGPQPMASPQQPMAAPMGGPAPGGMGGQLDPSMVNAVMGLQGQGTQRAQLDRQYKLADALRAGSSKMLEGRQIPSSTGGMYVGPNWASGLASVAGNVMADRNTRAADERGSALDKERQAAQRSYFDALTGADKKKKRPEIDQFETDPMAGY